MHCGLVGRAADFRSKGSRFHSPLVVLKVWWKKILPWEDFISCFSWPLRHQISWFEHSSTWVSTFFQNPFLQGVSWNFRLLNIRLFSRQSKIICIGTYNLIFSKYVCSGKLPNYVSYFSFHGHNFSSHSVKHLQKLGQMQNALVTSKGPKLY